MAVAAVFSQMRGAGQGPRRRRRLAGSWVLFDAEATSDADFTGTSALHDLVVSLRDRGVTFAVAEGNGRLMDALRISGIVELVGPDPVYPSVDTGAADFIAKHGSGGDANRPSSPEEAVPEPGSS